MTDAPRRKPKSSKGNLALQANAFRQVHVYVSMIVAPLLVFWTITGAFQVFRIPDKHPTSLLAKLASVHKNATFAGKAAGGGGRGAPGPAAGGSAPGPGGPPPAVTAQAGGRADQGAASARGGEAAGGRGGAAPARAPVKLATTLFKWYEALASIALCVSTFLGMWMGIAYHRRKGLMWLMLAIGIVVPVALLIAAV